MCRVKRMRTLIAICLILILALAGCGGGRHTAKEGSTIADIKHPGVVFIVRFKSKLPFDELKRRYEKRMPEFRALPGLIQKYYLHDPSSGEWCGVYLWDSQASLDSFLGSDLKKSIGAVYQVEGKPRVEVVKVVDVLREEHP